MPDQDDKDDGQGPEQGLLAFGWSVQIVAARSWLMRVAAQAAPKPLSMFTTVIPDAQLLSIANSAASPPNDAP